MTLNGALSELETTDPREVTPGQLAWLIESLEYIISEMHPCFAGKRTMIRLSGNLRAELSNAERRSVEIPDDGDAVDAAYMAGRDG